MGSVPNYAPQSFLKSDGTFEGFDIDVANEIAKRLGVTAKFETPDFSIVEAGNWAERFDISVGSVTITEKRKGTLDFNEPYYYTPAQMAAITAHGVPGQEAADERQDRARRRDQASAADRPPVHAPP